MGNKKKVIFLDRDGVINKFPGRGRYVTNLRNFKFIPGSLAAIKKLTKAGFTIFVISNQAGVAKGLYSRQALKTITTKMLAGIRKEGGKIKGVLYCMHSKEDNCPCRKPKIALIEKALKFAKLSLERKNSYLIGDDTLHDITMGRKAHLTTILVLSGKEKLIHKPSWALKPDYVFKNLFQAADFILRNNV